MSSYNNPHTPQSDIFADVDYSFAWNSNGTVESIIKLSSDRMLTLAFSYITVGGKQKVAAIGSTGA